MRKRRPGNGFEGGAFHSFPSKLVSCVASVALATMMVPVFSASAFASDGVNDESKPVAVVAALGISPSYDWYVNATGDSGEYVVSNEADLLGLAAICRNKALANEDKTTNVPQDDFTGKTVRLASDIDLGGSEWTPLEGFCGAFDGGGKTISNVVIHASDVEGYQYVGFFATLGHATVRNLALDHVDVHGFDHEVAEKSALYLGGLCGYLQFVDSAVADCKVTNVTVSGQSTAAGGLVGATYTGGSETKKLIITSCTVDNLTLSGKHRYAGGLIGNDGAYAAHIEGNYVKNGSVASQTGLYSGGIVGYSATPASYSNCSVSNLSVYAATYAGGFAGGYAYGGPLQVAAISEAIVASEKYAAGICGVVATNCLSMDNCRIDAVTIKSTDPALTHQYVSKGAFTAVDCKPSNYHFVINGEEIIRYSEGNLNYYLQSGTGTAHLIGCDDDFAGNIVIPDVVVHNGVSYDVTTMSASAFNGNKNITGLVLGKKLKSIPSSAFYGCSNIGGDLTIPDSVETIGEKAFQNCSGLDGIITIGNGVTKIEKHAFNGCSQVQKLILGSSLTYIGMASFANLTSLAGSLCIPASVEKLDGNGSYSGTGSFSNCSSLSAVVIKSPSVNIGAYVFQNCTSLNSLVLSGTATVVASKDAIPSTCVVYSGSGLVNGIASARALLNGGAFPDGARFEANMLAIPIKAGYVFDGWYGNAELTGDPVTVPQAGKIYYAKWAEACTVSFGGNGADSGEMASQTVHKGGKVELGANNFTRTGYTFAGWNTAADGTGTPYADKASLESSENVTLYAQWKANNYTVSFDGNGAASGAMDDQNATYDQDLVLPANGFERSGYRFAGWKVQGDETGRVVGDGATVRNLTAEAGGSVTLVAQWEPIYYPSPAPTPTPDPEPTPEPDQPDTPDTPQTPAVGDVVTMGTGAHQLAFRVTAVAGEDGKGGTVTVTSCDKNATEVDIPATIKIDGVSYKVTMVAAKAFKNSKKLEKVTIGKNVTYIGMGAFAGCSKLSSPTIGKGVKTITEGAFNGCTALRTVTLAVKDLPQKSVNNLVKGTRIKKVVVDTGSAHYDKLCAKKYEKKFSVQKCGKKGIKVKAKKK